jgi:hypothetical protein
VLHFALFDQSTQRWLEGQEGNEASIYGAMPCSTAFVQYATSRRAAALLSVSLDWWDLPETLPVRYENLVADPAGELARLIEDFGMVPGQQLEDALTATTFSNLRAQSGTKEVPELDHHYWQGRPGHWKRLLPPDVARTIGAAHAYLFDALDYDCDPDGQLDRNRADANWIEMNRPELVERLLNYSAMKLEMTALEQRCAILEGELAACRAHLGQPLAVRALKRLFGQRLLLP